MKIKLSNNENLEINSKVYVNGIGTYDGTNPVSGTNDLGTVIEGIQDVLESETVSDSEIDSLFSAAGLPTGSGSY